jgi:hypothetical protein
MKAKVKELCGNTFEDNICGKQKGHFGKHHDDREDRGSRGPIKVRRVWRLNAPQKFRSSARNGERTRVSNAECAERTVKARPARTSAGAS